jgi:uncharacterized phage protein (TIGR02218 family)
MSGCWGNHPWLSRDVVPIAWCWRIVRRDGVTVGLTTHDRAISVGGLIHSPAPGMRPSAIGQRMGLEAASMEIEGALSGSAMAEADLADGRWDGAAVRLSIVDWQNPERGEAIAEGHLGRVVREGVRFEATMAARDPVLERPACPATSPECRAILGDRQCRVALAPLRMRTSVTALSDDSEWVLAAHPGEGTLMFGRLRWLDGPRQGIDEIIIAQEGDNLRCEREGDAALVGARVELTQGCDKRAATCAERFANIANFRGEPHLPGFDLLTRYPGG